jgi:DeoR/GlpR family transcriptional regulator of sugar metabolism
VVDHTKFSKRGLFHLAPLTTFDLVIVDSSTSEQDVTMMKNLGVSVQVAHSENGKQQEYCIQVE